MWKEPAFLPRPPSGETPAESIYSDGAFFRANHAEFVECSASQIRAGAPELEVLGHLWASIGCHLECFRPQPDGQRSMNKT